MKISESVVNAVRAELAQHVHDLRSKFASITLVAMNERARAGDTMPWAGQTVYIQKSRYVPIRRTDGIAPAADEIGQAVRFLLGEIVVALRGADRPVLVTCRPAEVELVADDCVVVSSAGGELMCEISLYREYRRDRYEIAMVWGVASLPAEQAVAA